MLSVKIHPHVHHDSCGNVHRLMHFCFIWIIFFEKSKNLQHVNDLRSFLHDRASRIFPSDPFTLNAAKSELRHYFKLSVAPVKNWHEEFQIFPSAY